MKCLIEGQKWVGRRGALAVIVFGGGPPISPSELPELAAPPALFMEQPRPAPGNPHAFPLSPQSTHHAASNSGRQTCEAAHTGFRTYDPS